MVGSAAIKPGRSANRKHTYFFFGLNIAMMNLDISCFETSVDADQLASEATWLGFILFTNAPI